MLMLAATDQTEWRREHIPHRVRAAIALLDMEESILRVKDSCKSATPNRDHEIYWRCSTDFSIWEGRLAATRWLIELAGVCQKRPAGNSPAPSRRKPTDVFLEDFDHNPRQPV